jgi:hypothetical protein
MKSKIIILLSVLIATSLHSFAQVRLDPFYPYSKYTIGIGMGSSAMYGDLAHSNAEPVYRVNVARNANEWVCLDFQLQHGALSDYGDVTDHAAPKGFSHLSSYNQFTSFDVNGRLALGELFNWPSNFISKTIFGLYVGTGVGVMANNVSSINGKFFNTDKFQITDYDPLNIKKNRTNFYMPFNLGINLHLTRIVMINVNYCLTYAFSDYVDGYSFQRPVATNNYNDMYSVLSFGLSFYVGRISMTPNKRQ